MKFDVSGLTPLQRHMVRRAEKRVAEKIGRAFMDATLRDGATADTIVADVRAAIRSELGR